LGRRLKRGKRPSARWPTAGWGGLASSGAFQMKNIGALAAGSR